MSPKLCENARCVGCGACRAKCPRDAISFAPDAEGFGTPRVDAAKCVECGLCETVCPTSNPPRLAPRLATPDVYACWNNDPVVRAQSSSGGMFSVYATKIVERGGVVFGVAFDETLRATFVRAETVDELRALRSSKYVQAADAGDAYRAARRDLKSGRDVFFAGTPCQVAGLYAFLGDEKFPNLFSADLVCRGVPTPLLFKKWLRYLEEKSGGPICSLNFRGKSRGSSLNVALTVGSRAAAPIVFSWRDVRASYVDKAFVANFASRSSCFECRFNAPRVGDVTLGDFWKLGAKTPFPFDDEIERGVSLNLINDEQGRRLVALVRADATWIERDLREAQAGNPCLTRAWPPNAKRAEFLRDLQTLDYQTLTNRYRKELFGTPFQHGVRLLKRWVRRTLTGLRRAAKRLRKTSYYSDSP